MQKKISFPMAILINVNIVIGSGIFVNAKPLTEMVGPLGFVGYILAALLLFPFVWTLAKLAQANPVQGGLYAYSKRYLHPLAGFVGGWVYFVGKTVSAAFLAYKFSSFFQESIPSLHSIPTLLLASIVIFSLLSLNIAGAQIGGPIQFLFITIKIVPLLFGIIFGLTYLQPLNFSNIMPHLHNTLSTIPLTVYAFMGFELTCAIGHLIDKPEKNMLKIIFGSFFIVMTIYTLFQAFVFGALGTGLLAQGEPLTLLANKIFSYPIIGRIVTSFVFTSILAGSFGIFVSNSWNLHTIAKEGHLPCSKFLSNLSKKNIPWVSLLTEGLVACILLAISGNQIALQSMSVFGVVFSFVLSALAAIIATRNKQIRLPFLIPVLALGSCFCILYFCSLRIAVAGVSISYLLLLASGIFFACGKKYLCKPSLQ